MLDFLILVPLLFRSSFKKLQYEDYDRIYLKESQNGSIKASLLIHDVYQHFDEILLKKNLNWLELPNQYLYVNQVGFTHFANVFFSAALQKAVEAFTDTGIIQHLFQLHYPSKRYYQHSEDFPNVLTLQDLSFGFNIWIGACCFSVVAFLLELIMLMCKALGKRIETIQRRQINHEKVHPASSRMDYQNRSVKAETVRKFRVIRTDSKLPKFN